MRRVISRVLETVTRRNRADSLRGLPKRYSILRELGRGGVAVVYLARDRQLERDVAIKVLHATHSDDPNNAARLEHEARFVASLQHPHIVAIYDLQQLRNRNVALVMQYVRGQTLRGIIDEQGPLSIAFVERVLREIAGALALAHRYGIVHRDVKPENIYLDEVTGRALLADFGIARGPSLEAGLTLAGEALGTPHYMSPEHISGGELDGRSDLYSLGLVGYEMLTGERPWAGETLYHILHKQQHQNLPPLRYRRTDIPPSLRGALEQAMKKKREERPDSADSFLSILSRGETGSAQEAERPGDDGSRFGSTVVVEAVSSAPTVRYRRPSDVDPGVPATETSAPINLVRHSGEPSAAAGAAPPLPSDRDTPSWLRGASGGTSSAGDSRGQQAEYPWLQAGPYEGAGSEPSLQSSRGDAAAGTGPHFTRTRNPAMTGPVRTDETAPTEPPVADEAPTRLSPRARTILVRLTILIFLLVVLVIVLARGGPPEPAAGRAPAAAPRPDTTAISPRLDRSAGQVGATSGQARGGGGGGGGGGGSRSSAGRVPAIGEWRYKPAGDLTDTFCRPRAGELLTDWQARVPEYCQERAE